MIRLTPPQPRNQDGGEAWNRPSLVPSEETQHPPTPYLDFGLPAFRAVPRRILV